MDKVTTRRINRAGRLLSLNLPENKKWIVWWYGPLIKSRKRNKQPKVAIFFRELNNDGTITDVYQEQICPLTDLKLLKVGSVWVNNVCISEVVFEERNFDVDFTYKNGGWSIFPLNKMDYDFSDYFLSGVDDKVWLLDFLLKNGARLIIPALEFFYRCYGWSDELKRTLLMYPMEDVRNRLFSSAEYKGKNVLYVKLRKRIYNKDTPFVAFFALDDFTQEVVKRIRAQLVNEECKVYLKIAPWFREKTKIRVKGIRTGKNNIFLGLEVTGYPLPGREFKVIFDRDNTNFVKEKADAESKKAWDSVPGKKLNMVNDSFFIDNTFEPDSGASTLDIQISSLEIIGSSCTVVSLRKDKAEYFSGAKLENKAHSTYSVNKSTGEKNDVGYVSGEMIIKSKELMMESNGIVRDMWNAILYLSTEHPGKIISVEWYTPETLYSDDPEPRLVAIPEFDNENVVKENIKISKTILNWPYLDNLTKKGIRGFLVVKITFDEDVVYLLEIQRRYTHEYVNDSVSEDEKFKGMVFKLNNANDIYVWVSFLAHELRYVKGIVQKLTGKCPGIAMVYKHAQAKKEPVPGFRALLNALRKIGVSI